MINGNKIDGNMNNPLQNENEILTFIKELIIKEKENGLICEVGSIIYDPHRISPTFRITSPTSHNIYKISIEQITQI